MRILGESRWQRVALATTDMWLLYIPVAVRTKGRYFYFPVQAQKDGFDPALQNHIGAGIISLNIGYDTGAAKIGRPVIRWRRVANQAAFFMLPASEIIPIEKAAFFTSRCFHLVMARDGKGLH